MRISLFMPTSCHRKVMQNRRKMLMLPNTNVHPTSSGLKTLTGHSPSLNTSATMFNAFHLKLFSDSTADATKEGHIKLTAKDGKAQQYAVLTKHIFAAEPGQSALYLQNPTRYGTAVETRLWWYDHLLTVYLCQLTSSSLKCEYVAHLKVLRNTGAGLDPCMITKGSPIANIIGTYIY